MSEPKEIINAQGEAVDSIADTLWKYRHSMDVSERERSNIQEFSEELRSISNKMKKWANQP